VVDEAFAPLLAVGQDVEADLLLLAQRQRRGIVLRLAQRLAFQPKGGAAALRRRQPGGAAGCPRWSPSMVNCIAIPR
jgi:hypothetical protein